ncbi:MAG: DUF3267 domain-containing protein [Anaerovoracaceae bacterium]
MNSDSNEKKRRLSPAEERRISRFNEISEQMRAEGYSEHDLTISLVRANIAVIIAAIPLFAAVVFIFTRIHPEGLVVKSSWREIIIFVAALVLLPVVHELIHGFVWAIFSKDHFHDIEFGVIPKYGAAYCTCRRPLKRAQYALGGVMPLIVLGLIPLVWGITAGNVDVTFLALYMTLAAGGDVMILLQLMRFRTDARDVVIYDHPTQGGCVVFTK